MIEAIEGNLGTNLNVRCFLPAGGPQKNWDAFLLASFLQIFRGQIFLNNFWHWSFGHPPESSNSSDVDATTFFLMTPFVRVARCAKRSCPFNRKGVSLGRMEGKKVWGWWSVEIHTELRWFPVFLDVCVCVTHEIHQNVVAGGVVLLIQLGASPGLL